MCEGECGFISYIELLLLRFQGDSVLSSFVLEVSFWSTALDIWSGTRPAQFVQLGGEACSHSTVVSASKSTASWRCVPSSALSIHWDTVHWFFLRMNSDTMQHFACFASNHALQIEAHNAFSRNARVYSSQYTFLWSAKCTCFLQKQRMFNRCFGMQDVYSIRRFMVSICLQGTSTTKCCVISWRHYGMSIWNIWFKALSM